MKVIEKILTRHAEKYFKLVEGFSEERGFVWAAASVRAAIEAGIITGEGEAGDLTPAETLTLANEVSDRIKAALTIDPS